MKFRLGDKVRVVNYGSRMWVHANMVNSMKNMGSEIIPKYIIETFEDGSLCFDAAPYRIGIEDIITSISYASVGGMPKYGLSKTAWYDEEQLELIN